MAPFLANSRPVSFKNAVNDDKAHYYPGADNFITKLIVDKNTKKLLGIQVMGPGAVDKMVDIGVTAISLGAALEQLENLDLAYAPPFSRSLFILFSRIFTAATKG